MYLSKKQRELIMIAGCAGGAVREWLDCAGEMAPDEKKRLRSAATNIEKGMESYLRRLDRSVAMRIYKELQESTLQVAVDREIAAESSEKLVKEDDLYTMGEFITWAICQNEDETSPWRCTVKEEGKSFKKCRLYNAMINMGLARASYVKGQCPYKL